MSIDKSCTRPTLNRNSPEFKLGLNDFYERCKAYINDRGLCCYPCRMCGNRDKLIPINIKHHIHNNGFSKGYPTWVHHDEPRITPPPIIDDTNYMINVLNDVLKENNYIEPEPNTEHNTNTTSTSNMPPEVAGPTKDDMEGLFEMANEELFPASFLTGAKLPKSYYEAKKSMKKVGLGYESINACINNCCLFWGKDNKDEEICPTCKASRWKNKDTIRKKVPNKVLRYFPLIPRLKRMYGSLHTTKHMTWHATGKCTEDGKMGHPVDGKVWKEFDKNNPEFTKEHRNVRLGLAADCFNPLGNVSQSYSMWPVILTTYNTPLWICMKEFSFMLTCLIPGTKSPGKDMDVYLQPLVKELKTLWKKPGVKTLDVSTNTEFSMRAMLLWTISDFPAHSSLSGWSGQGYLAYPTYGEKKKLPIKFDLNELSTAKPIRPNRRHFTGLIGNKIERSVPFYYKSWDALPDKYKRTLWPAIHTYFDMRHIFSGPNAKQIKKGMEAQFKGQYRNRKNKFKDDMFVSHGGYEQSVKIQNFPLPGKSLSEWHKLCDHFTSEKHLTHSLQNKANRAKLS
ncbi:CACTA transposable element [Tanacetum coccineum]